MAQRRLPARLRTMIRVLWIVVQTVLALWMARSGGQFYYQGF